MVAHQHRRVFRPASAGSNADTGRRLVEACVEGSGHLSSRRVRQKREAEEYRRRGHESVCETEERGRGVQKKRTRECMCVRVCVCVCVCMCVCVCVVVCVV